MELSTTMSTGCEDENDVTKDTNHDSEPEFDSSDDDDFDLYLWRLHCGR